MAEPAVSFLYWTECPSWERALEIARTELTAQGLSQAALELIEITDEHSAACHRFPGSPTIRVDGEDIEDPGAAPIGLTCRVYRRSDGRISPLPDRAKLEAALRKSKGVGDG